MKTRPMTRLRYDNAEHRYLRRRTVYKNGAKTDQCSLEKYGEGEGWLVHE